MKTTKRIESYLDGSLTEDERIQFEKNISGDNELSSLVKLHEEVNRSISDAGLHLLKTRLDEITELYRRKRRSVCFITIAAAVLFLAALTIALRFILWSDADASGLFEKYYQPYDADIITRSEEKGLLFEQGVIEYQIGNYTEAIQKFEIVKEDSGADINMVNFYLGLACIGSAEYDKAVVFLGSIPPEWNNPFGVHRDWYMALAYIADDRSDNAVIILSQMAGHKGVYFREARQILRKLK